MCPRESGMKYHDVSLSIQIGQDVIEDIKRLASELKIDPTEYVADTENGKFSRLDFVMNDMSSMLADCFTETLCRQPGYWEEVQSNYHSDLMDMYRTCTGNPPPNVDDESWRLADEYLEVAHKFCQHVVGSDQLLPLIDHFDSMSEKQHIMVLPETRPIFSDDGVFIVRYSITSTD